MIYTRHIPAGEVLDTVNLSIATRNPISTQAVLKTYLTLMTASNFLPIFAIDVTEMDGFCETPDRYWIQANTKRICVYVNYDADNITQRFTWKTEGKADIVVTSDITSDSIVFLEVQGDTLSYGNDKLIFIENSLCPKHPITVAFIDNYGLPQTISLETGAFSISDNVTNTFKSLSGEITYDADKTPYNVLTIGSNAIPRQMQLFIGGFTNSRNYQALLSDGSIIDTFMKDASITADRYTSTYAFSGVLQFNTADLHTLQFNIGELNINDN